MQVQSIVPLVFAFLALVAGVGLLLMRVDSEQLHASSRSLPDLALFRFRAYRYGMALVCFTLAAVAVAIWAGAV